MRRLFPLSGTITVGLALSGTPAAADHAGIGIRPHWEQTEAMQHYREELYAVHKDCAAAAKVMMIGQTQAQQCANVFLRLKLSFLNGVTIDRFSSIKVGTRAVAHDKGYAAFRAWEHRQKLQRD